MHFASTTVPGGGGGPEIYSEPSTAMYIFDLSCCDRSRGRGGGGGGEAEPTSGLAFSNVTTKSSRKYAGATLARPCPFSPWLGAFVCLKYYSSHLSHCAK